jgi:hypothetical protein
MEYDLEPVNKQHSVNYPSTTVYCCNRRFHKSIIRRVVFEICSCLIVIGLGSILHFVYGWANSSAMVAWFAATNESALQHMKLAVFPYVVPWAIYALIEYKYHQEHTEIFVSRVCGWLVTLAFIPSFWLVCLAIVSYGVLALDIINFVLAIVLGHVVSGVLGVIIFPPLINFCVAHCHNHRTCTFARLTGISLIVTLICVIVVLVVFIWYTYHRAEGLLTCILNTQEPNQWSATYTCP